ncbi:MAG TPA: hypothetical protein VFA09_01625 [Ktedonobacteraceae bacterium]|nr:hypothetical protein [Ktedonobacteraceae bacterium]HZU65951.1 hypothetical protein [Ktedonobacteraceae bacterium]
MASQGLTQNVRPRLWIAVAATIITFIVSLLVSISLYLLEDGNPLTQAAYSASPLVRFSYDAVYLSALVACVAVCAIVGYAITRSTPSVVFGLILISLLIIFGGFGGLLVRYPATFLVFFIAFAGLLLLSLVAGRMVAGLSTRYLGQRTAAIVGACLGAFIVMLVNAIALVLHTMALNPASHALFMQGQIGETHYNSLIIGMAIEVVLVLFCGLSIWFVLRSPGRLP